MIYAIKLVSAACSESTEILYDVLDMEQRAVHILADMKRQLVGIN